MMKIGSLRDAVVSGSSWLSWLLLAAAVLILTPTAGFFLAFLAVTCAIFPLALGSTKLRIAALVVVVLGALLAGSLVQKAKDDPWFKKQRATQVLQTG